MQNVPKLEPYKLYSLIIEKISHTIRTPLGVSRSIVKDAAQGEVLELVDFKDAYNANQRMLSYLDLVKKISTNLDSKSSEEYNLRELIPLEFLENVHIAEGVTFEVVKLKAHQLLYCLLSYFIELKNDSDEIKVYAESQKVIIEISSKTQLQKSFSEGFFQQIIEDGRLASISFLVAMLLQPEMQYKLIEQKKFQFYFSF